MAVRRSKGDGAIFYSEALGCWVGRVERERVGGKRRNRTFKGETRKAVAAEVKRFLRAQEEGAQADGRMTLETYLRRWLSEGAPSEAKPKTFAGYESIVRVRIVPRIGHIRLDKLTALDVQAMTNALQRPRKRGDKEIPGLSKRSALNTYRCLHGALRQAVDWKLVAHNVADSATRPRATRKEIHPLTRDEVIRFLASSNGAPDHPLWTVAITTGMRQGELLGLRWQDVDLSAKRLRVVQTLQRVTGLGLVFGSPKTEHSRRSISLTDEAVRVFKGQRARQNVDRLRVANLWEDHDLVFPRSFGRPADPKAVRDRLRTGLKRAGVSEVRFHDLRHTCATLLFEAGTHPKVVSELLGHANVGITLDIYSHYVPTLHEQAAAAMDRLLGT